MKKPGPRERDVWPWPLRGVMGPETPVRGSFHATTDEKLSLVVERVY